MIFIHRNIQLPCSLVMKYDYKPLHKWTFSYHKIGQLIALSPKTILNIKPTNELKSLITKQQTAKVGKLAITNKVWIRVEALIHASVLKPSSCSLKNIPSFTKRKSDRETSFYLTITSQRIID